MPGDEWTLYAGHRARFTEAVLSCAQGESGRLCVLGAGACNDVDLEQLARAFTEIHLVDLDAGALARAVSRQLPAVRSRLRPHGGVDLSGFTKRLQKWKRRAPTVAQVEASGKQTVHELLGRLPGPFDVAVSACVLTQMSFAVRRKLGDDHPALELVRFAVNVTHLTTLVELTAVGGSSLFVSDLTSSSAFSADALRAATDLRALMDGIVRDGAAYHSSNPDLIRTLLANGALGESVGEPELLDPWLWDGQHDRTYLVYALRIPRHAAT